MTLPRGFKARAEEAAVEWRREVGLQPDDPIDLAVIAERLGAQIVDAGTLVDRSRLEELENLQAFAFSAATFEIGVRRFIVTNPLRSSGRMTSDIAHEIAHLDLSHQLAEVRDVGGVTFRTCRPDEEEQATTYGATLVLPRPLLLSAARRGMGPTEIADEFSVTLEMARFRFNSTGVARQVRARGA